MAFLQDLARKAKTRASQIYDQVNPLDNGRTYQQRNPIQVDGNGNARSIIGQLSHNGVTNTVGNLVAKPFVINPAQHIIETGRMIAADATSNVAAQRASQARELQNWHNSLPHAILNPMFNAGRAYTYDLGRQTIADLTGNEQASANANDEYMRRLNQTPIGSLLNMPQRKLAAYQVHRDAPNMTADQQKQAINQNLEQVNIDPKANFLTQLKETGAGALQLAAPTFGIAKAGITGQTAGDYLSGATFAGMAKSGFNNARNMVTKAGPTEAMALREAVPNPGIKTNVTAKPSQAAAAQSPQAALQAQLPKGYKVDKTGTVFNPKGQEVSIGQIQDLTQASYLTKFEQASRSGDTATMQQIAAQHPNDARVHIDQTAVQGTHPVVDPVTNKIVEVPNGPTTKAPLPTAEVPQGAKLSRFANKTVQKSMEVSPELKKIVKDRAVTYEKVNRADVLATAQQAVEKRGLQNSYADAMKALQGKNSSVGDIAAAIETAKRLDAKGGEANLQLAADLHAAISKNASIKGQEVWVQSLLNNRTPEGLMHSAQKTLRQGGVEVTPELQAGLKGFIDRVRGTQPGTEARDLAVKQLQQFVAKQIPSPVLDKMISTWKAGLLTGIKTVTGNAVSNSSFRLGHEISKPLAVGIDKLMSLKTGQRSQALTFRGVASGAGEGFQKGWEYFKTGIDERAGVGNKFLEHGRETNFKNKVVNAYVNGVFRNMAAQDRPFYYSQLRTSLNELASVEGINKGLKGNKLRSFVEKRLKDPGIDMMQKAKLEADKAVLANDTALGKSVGALRQGIDKMEPGVGRTVLKAGLETTMPFTGVPAAFVSRVLDFTPVGAIKEIANQIAHKQFDQRALSTALSEATNGTAVMFLGAELAKNNMLSGPYPNDPKEQARWKAEGITPNSIKIGNKWISLNYLGPAGMLFNAGGRAEQARREGSGITGQVGAAVGGAPKDLTQQSFLQGLSNAVGAINDPGRYFNNYINSQAGSVIPTIINDIGNATDSNLRDRNNVGDALKSRIPGLRNTLPKSVDAFGNELKATSNPLDRLANPLRPSSERSNPLFGEINRLHDNELDVMLTPQKNSQVFDGVRTNLSDAQKRQLQINIGQNVQNLWGQAMQTPEYKSLTDEGKANMLKSIYSKVSEGEKAKYAAQNNMGQYAPGFNGKAGKPSKDARNYIEGNFDITKFAKEKGTSGGGSSLEINKNLNGDYKKILTAYDNMDKSERNQYFASSNDAEYKFMQAKYENDIANGDLSKADAARGKYDLARAKVGSKYTQEIRDLYSLNKTELYSVLSSDPGGARMAEAILKYGDDLQAAGLGKNKFRDSKGRVALAPSDGKSSGGRGGGRKGLADDGYGDMISAVTSISRKNASAKVGKASFQSKVGSGRTLKAYAKPSSTRVASAKQITRRLA